MEPLFLRTNKVEERRYKSSRLSLSSTMKIDNSIVLLTVMRVKEVGKCSFPHLLTILHTQYLRYSLNLHYFYRFQKTAQEPKHVTTSWDE